MTRLFFEDFAAGQTMPEARVTVSATDAVRFMAAFGRQAGMASAEAGPEVLSGLYVSALGMRLVFDAFLDRTAGLGAPGIEAVEWPHPVFAGDELRLRAKVAAVRPSASRREMGLVTFDFALLNQHEDCVMTQSNVILVQRRTGGGGP